MTTASLWHRFRWRLSSMRICWVYVIILALVILGFLAYVISLYYHHPVPDALVQAFGAFATAFALVTALAGAYPPRRKVKIAHEAPWLSNRCEKPYKLGVLPDELQKIFRPYGKEFYTYRVNLRLTNESGFDLKSPIISVEVPADRQHPWPVKENGQDKWALSLNNSIMQMGPESWVCEDAGTIVLTGRPAIYWNRGKARHFWVRMVLKRCYAEPFSMQISVNCENAEEGFADEIEINSGRLLCE